MRKLVWILTLLLLVTSIAGCDKGLELVILGADGNAAGNFEDENIAIWLQMEKGMVTLVTQRKGSRSATLLWPQDNLTLSDGSIYTLCYVSGKHFNEDAYYGNLQYLSEGGQSATVVRRSLLEHVLNPYLFADTSPMELRPEFSGGLPEKYCDFPRKSPLIPEWPRIAAIRDPQDFTAPIKYPMGSDSFFYLETLAKRLKAGDKLTWVLEYRLEETGEVVDRNLTLMVIAK